MKKILETERLILRNFVMEDNNTIFEILADGGMPHRSQFGPLDVNYARGFLNHMIKSYNQNGFGLWAIIEKETKKLIGYCGLHTEKIDEKTDVIELAYRIHKKLWCKGLATEAAIAVRDYSFTVLKLPEIVSCIAHDNQKSLRVAEKIGLSYWREGVWKGTPCRVYRKNNKTVV